MDGLSITLNGETRMVPASRCLGDLVAELGIRPERVAIEVNQRVVPRAEHATRPVAAGDCIEVVTFVGGG